MNGIDIVVLVIFAAVALDGVRAGFIKTVFSIIKMVIGGVLAVVLCSLLSDSFPEILRHVIPVLFMSVFGIVFGILCAVERLLNLVDKIPVAKDINKIAGIAAGAVKAVVIIWVLCCISGYFSYTELGGKICDIVYSSGIIKVVNRYNPFWMIVKMWWDMFPYTVKT